MARSIIGFPIRLGLRGVSIAVDGAMTVAGHALGLAGRLAEALTQDGDARSRHRRQRARAQRAARASRDRGASCRGAAGNRAGPPRIDPTPVDPTPTHVSEEAVLVDEVAEAGAEDGAGAEVHVDEPWKHYDELGADDVIDRITGASTAELATVQLYEQSHRRRKTVLEAVERELRRQPQ